MFPGLTKGNAKVNYGNSTYALKMVSKKMEPIAQNGSFGHIVVKSTSTTESFDQLSNLLSGKLVTRVASRSVAIQILPKTA
jgi:hypothetical protein